MPIYARQGAVLFIFGLLVNVAYYWHLTELQTIDPLWLNVITLVGVLGFSANLVALMSFASRGAVRAGRRVSVAARAPAQAAKPAEDAPTTAVASDDQDAEAILRQSRLVDLAWYSQAYPDVAEAGFDVEQHYLHHGAEEGRNPNAFFDTAWYLAHNPDVVQSGVNPLLHYVTDGAGEGRAAGPDFDTAFYLSHNEDVRTMGINPLLHYLSHGRSEGRRASAQ